MSRLNWDQAGTKLYETGVDRGVLYVFDTSVGHTGRYQAGVAWNGLTAVTDSPSGAEANDLYADNIKYLSLMSVEELGLTIEAYTYPEEFEACDGTAALGTGVNIGQQPRQHFGFTYRTRIGDDEVGDSKGYKLHLVYDCLASPSEKAYSTVNDSPEAITFSWEITTTKIDVGSGDYRPISSITIDSTKIDSAKLTAIENILYGKDATTGTNATAATDPDLPLPAKIIEILEDSTIVAQG